MRGGRGFAAVTGGGDDNNSIGTAVQYQTAALCVNERQDSDRTWDW